MRDSIADPSDITRDPNYLLGAANAKLAVIRKTAEDALVPADVEDLNPFDALEQILKIAKFN